MPTETLPSSCAVFPLPNCVLFPKVLQPLRIFEPRYKQMLEHVLDTQGWLAVALWQSQREYDDRGHPDVFPIAGLGRLVDYQKVDDGTYKIVLWGERRVLLRDWVQVKPYPICTIDPCDELEPPDPQRQDIRDGLRERLKGLVGRTVDSQVLMLLEQTITSCDEIGPLIDSIAFHFLNDPFEKQRLLETSDAAARQRSLIEALTRQRFGSAPGETAPS